jgi:hypothetical protein
LKLNSPSGAVFRALVPLLAGQLFVLAVVVAVPALVHVFDPTGSSSRGPELDAKGKADAAARGNDFTLPPIPFGAPSLPAFDAPKKSKTAVAPATPRVPALAHCSRSS